MTPFSLPTSNLDQSELLKQHENSKTNVAAVVENHACAPPPQLPQTFAPTVSTAVTASTAADFTDNDAGEAAELNRQ